MHGYNNPQDFYELCSKKSNISEVNDYLLKELDSNILLYGMLGAIENNQSKYVDLIISYIENKKIKFDTLNTNVISNCAIKHDNLELLNTLNDKFSNLDNLKNERYVRLDNKGKVVKVTELPHDAETGTKSHYIGNPFLFSSVNFHIGALEFLLDKCPDMHPTVVENAFVENCVLENTNAVFYFVEHAKIRTVLNNSTLISSFLSEGKELQEIKQKAKSSLAMMNLNDELSTNINTNKPKLKM